MGGLLRLAGGRTFRSDIPQVGVSQFLAEEPASTSGSLLMESSERFIAVAKQAKASVVNVSSTRKLGGGENPPESPLPFFDGPFIRLISTGRATIYLAIRPE